MLGCAVCRNLNQHVHFILTTVYSVTSIILAFYKCLRTTLMKIAEKWVFY